MRREVTETGKTVEEAINAACEQLGVDRDDVEWEIVDLPRKGFLGLKNLPAKVKVWKDESEAPVAKQESKRERREQPVASRMTAPKKESRPPAPAPKKDVEEKVIELTGETAHKVDIAIDYLRGVCKTMGLDPSFTPKVQEGGVCINISGDGLGAIIGRRGETLDSLQYLSSLVANRLDGDYLRLTLDCGDYRTKRKATLEALAKKLSSQVLKTNTSKTLEPMNPFERRIIHATVSNIEGVSSTSIGEEPNRRVVISSPTSRPARGGRSGGSSGGNRRPGGGGGSRGGRPSGGGNRPRRSGPPPRRENRSSNQGGTINTLPQGGSTTFRPSEPKKTPEATNNNPLYTKLDLD